MSNANRDYAIVYDVKNSSLVLSRPLIFYITDKNTSNIFVKLVTRINAGNGIDQYTEIEDASNYILTMRVIKPNNGVKSIDAIQHEPESIFQFDLNEDFKDIPGKYICELTISTIVNSRQELITSDPFNYEVKRSILSNVDEIIETEDTTVEDVLNRVDGMQHQINNIILSAVEGNNAEIVQARGRFSILNDRLDTTDRYINSFHKNINNEISFTVEAGSITSGINSDSDYTKQHRARTIEMNYAEGSTKIIRLNNEYSFSVITYDKGTWDGNDVGWLNVDSYTVPRNKYFRLNFKKTDNSAITDLDVISRGFKIIHEGASKDKFNYLDNRVFTKMMLDINDFEYGAVTNGANANSSTRIRTIERIQLNHNDTIVFTKNPANCYYGVSVYDENGDHNGIDYGWLKEREFVMPQNGYVKLVLRYGDDREITNKDELASNSFIIKKSNFLTEEHIATIKEELDEDLKITRYLNTADFVIGSISGGVDSESNNRVRTSEKISLKKDKVITFKNNSDNNIYYGVAIYDETGNPNGVDYGWLQQSEFRMPQNGYIKLALRYADNRIINNSNIDALVNGTITIPRTIQEVNDSVNNLKIETTDKITKNEAINSILVEYGRIQGASYVFVRIPKTLNNGKIITPRVRLTSADGSISGAKRSTLDYARDNDCIFTVNAGLFNITTIEPVGQLIIDGVSLINTPMVDDNGIPISDSECYPLAIDANGKFTTYPRNVDTSTMLNDGIQYAVTSWGKLVDNFQICTEDINNEIVHPGKYIRQSIGQYQNGDYCVCTVDMTRGNVQNEAGLSYEELAQIFVDKGVKFAYSLDGGGSAETVLGKRQLNPIYEGSTGRKVPTVIEFVMN